MLASPLVRNLRSLVLGLAAAGAVAAAGCQGPVLVATPNVLIKQDPDHVFGACAAACQGPDMDVLYATDRDAADTPQGMSYGYGRARRLAFGVATVKLDPNPTWKELIADSTRQERRESYALHTGACQQLGSFNPMLDRLQPHAGGVQLASEVVSDFAIQQKNFQGLLAERLAQSPQKDVYVFVHGVNNSFEDSLFRAAEVWHFLGRTGVPVVYSWPAGYGGLRGYAYDRESGEFTVFHFKYFLQMVATCPGVERVHIVAHSRGSDVAITALRELHIACRAQGKDTQAELKLENLVLAAPDLDEDVFMQRFVAENLLRAAHRTTIYTSASDRAIRLADVVFASRRRVGLMGPRDFSPAARQILAKLPNLQFIDCKVNHFGSSHDYVFAHPAALSDLILVLRDSRPPGVESGRPLLQPVAGVWELHNDYLARRD
jgi:esterase/lipase superfamily enzyme